jgi:hypothetical protein
MPTLEAEIPIRSLPGYVSVAALFEKKTKCGCTLVRDFLVRNHVEEGRFATTVSLVLVHDREDKEGVEFVFSGVTGLEIKDTHQISGLAVRDIRSRGWEAARFEVYDYEGGALRFFCWHVALSLTKNEET